MTMTDAELAEIRVRAEAATPGPWRYYPWLDPGEAGSVESDTTWICGIAPEADGTDAAFIAHARTDVEALLDELATARKENERLREVLQDVLDNVAPQPQTPEDSVNTCQVLDRVYAALHSATEDADDRTT